MFHMESLNAPSEQNGNQMRLVFAIKNHTDIVPDALLEDVDHKFLLDAEEINGREDEASLKHLTTITLGYTARRRTLSLSLY